MAGPPWQAESCIWDPENNDHKDSFKKNDAWQRISNITKKSIPDLKAKKETLMGAFRKHMKKKNESIRSGAGADDIYKPIWFAYDLMESFLLPIYTCKTGLNSETQSRSPEPNIEQSVESENNSIPATPLPFVETPQRPERRRKNTPDNSIAEQQMATAFGQLTNALTSQSKQPPKQKEDECDLYAKLLALKLRELAKDERKLMMYEIDGLFINKTNQKSFYRDTPSPQYSSMLSSSFINKTNQKSFNRDTPSPQYSSRSSSSASNYIIKRPRSIYTYPEQFSQSNSIQHKPSPPLTPNAPVDYDSSSNNIFSQSNSIKHKPSPPLTPNAPVDYDSSSINILSDEMISSSHNIINEAYMKAYEDFESEQQ